jgi:hypothetical protein
MAERLGNLVQQSLHAPLSLSSSDRNVPPRVALTAATDILSAFRKSDVEDPQAYVTGLCEVLSAYPLEVIAVVAHRTKGIAGEQTFLPSFAEVKACCDKHYGPILTREARERREAEFFAAREERRREERERAERGASVDRVTEHWDAVRREMTAAAEAGKPAPEPPAAVLARTSGLPREEVEAKLTAFPAALMTEERKRWLARGGDLRA